MSRRRPTGRDHQAPLDLSGGRLPPPAPMFTPERKTIVANGEMITCTRGHAICEAAEALTALWPLKAAQFRNWRHQGAPVDEHHRISSIACTTPGCEGVWMNRAHTAIRVELKWRTA